jgi:hypothetical protein
VPLYGLLLWYWTAGRTALVVPRPRLVVFTCCVPRTRWLCRTSVSYLHLPVSGGTLPLLPPFTHGQTGVCAIHCHAPAVAFATHSALQTLHSACYHCCRVLYRRHSPSSVITSRHFGRFLADLARCGRDCVSPYVAGLRTRSTACLHHCTSPTFCLLHFACFFRILYMVRVGLVWFFLVLCYFCLLVLWFTRLRFAGLDVSPSRTRVRFVIAAPLLPILWFDAVAGLQPLPLRIAFTAACHPAPTLSLVLFTLFGGTRDSSSGLRYTPSCLVSTVHATRWLLHTPSSTPPRGSACSVANIRLWFGLHSPARFLCATASSLGFRTRRAHTSPAFPTHTTAAWFSTALPALSHPVPAFYLRFTRAVYTGFVCVRFCGLRIVPVPRWFVLPSDHGSNGICGSLPFSHFCYRFCVVSPGFWFYAATTPHLLIFAGPLLRVCVYRRVLPPGSPRFSRVALRAALPAGCGSLLPRRTRCLSARTPPLSRVCQQNATRCADLPAACGWVGSDGLSIWFFHSGWVRLVCWTVWFVFGSYGFRRTFAVCRTALFLYYGPRSHPARIRFSSLCLSMFSPWLRMVLPARIPTTSACTPLRFFVRSSPAHVASLVVRFTCRIRGLFIALYYRVVWLVCSFAVTYLPLHGCDGSTHFSTLPLRCYAPRLLRTDRGSAFAVARFVAPATLHVSRLLPCASSLVARFYPPPPLPPATTICALAYAAATALHSTTSLRFSPVRLWDRWVRSGSLFYVPVSCYRSVVWTRWCGSKG